MSSRYRILEILGDGRFHSGEDVGRELGISRTAIWKHLQALGKLGIDIHAVQGKGYRLADPVELLERTLILAAMGEDMRRRVSGLEIHHEIDSTNTYLMSMAGRACASGYVCLAEQQQAGRGRRGREWVSPFAANVYLSVLWRFTMNPALLSGLGLAVGVAVARMLRQLGLRDVGLKWPNDVIWQGRKLAGILLDMTGEAFGTCNVVAGIGLNTRMQAQAAASIDQPWANVEEALGAPVSRNELAGRLLEQVFIALQQFEQAGLQAFLEEWRALDIIAGHLVHLQLHGRTVSGIAAGVDATGALLLRDHGVTTSYQAGEVSVRTPLLDRSSLIP